MSAIALALALLAPVGGAPAKPAAAAFELAWEAPEGCPDAAGGHARIERFLGRSTGAAGDPDLRAAVTLSQQGASWLARVTIDDTTRTLQASRCEVVADAAAYALAAFIDPNVAPPEPADDPPPPEPQPQPQPPPRTEPEPARTPTPSPPPRRRSPLRAAIRIAPGVAVGP
ncbi:MAG: hypothetical protein K1X88_04480, partial [Nannocystaceae bacterium]|nr:hypothetical protein [Nannocystaceae bacterium]